MNNQGFWDWFAVGFLMGGIFLPPAAVYVIYLIAT